MMRRPPILTLRFRVRLFWVKMISGNHFPPNSHCLAATENEIFQKFISCWPIFTPLTRIAFYTLIFSSNHFRKKRERERERERGESPDWREREEEERAGDRRGAWSSDEREERADDRRSRRSSDDRTDLTSDLASPARSHLLLHCAISIWPDFRWIFLLGFVSSVSVELSACFVSSLSACLQLRNCVENWSCKAFSVKVFEWAKHRN